MINNQNIVVAKGLTTDQMKKVKKIKYKQAGA